MKFLISEGIRMVGSIPGVCFGYCRDQAATTLRPHGVKASKISGRNLRIFCLSPTALFRHVREAQGSRREQQGSTSEQRGSSSHLLHTGLFGSLDCNEFNSTQ